ncbi:hypothetical protein TKK_0004002 [Trichogramma kaykai]
MKRESRASSNISEDCIEGDDEQEGKATYPKSCNRCRQEEGRTAHDHKDISPSLGSPHGRPVSNENR